MEKGVTESFQLSERVEVSVVIPHFYGTREDNLAGLVQDLRDQTFKEMEILIVKGVSPQGKAINQGVRMTKGKILVTLDDDSRMGHPRVLENLVRILREDPTVGMVGASVVTSDNANWFQKMAGKQFPRYHMPIVDEAVESDLPGHPCAAFPKDVFIKAGMEREDILRGLDPDLRMRIRKAGYRIVLAPQTWIHHPFPKNLFQLIWTFVRNGYGSAYLQRFYPEIAYDTDESLDSKQFRPKRSFFHRLIRYPIRLGSALLSFQWIRFLGYSVYLLGYLIGSLRFLFSRHPAVKL